MRMVDIIAKKRDGLELSVLEINALITGFTNDTIHDYQMAAWLLWRYTLGNDRSGNCGFDFGDGSFGRID